MNRETLDTLLDIKTSIEKENVSYGEISYLQNHQEEILELGDVVLAEWAGIPEEVFMARVYDGKIKEGEEHGKD